MRTLQVIKEPMDLSLIRERIMSGALMSLDDMSRDLFVMCNNAMVFNGKGDPYFDYSKVRRACTLLRRPRSVTAALGTRSCVTCFLGVLSTIERSNSSNPSSGYWGRTLYTGRTRPRHERKHPFPCSPPPPAPTHSAVAACRWVLGCSAVPAATTRSFERTRAR